MNTIKNMLSFRNIFAALLVSFLLFSSCEKDKDLDTNPLNSKDISVKVYGPNPGLRGQDITFVGTHLSQISKVVFSPGVEVTDIRKESEIMIKVKLPQEAVAGPVRLYTAAGAELTFETPLEISEPVSITSMNPQPVKAGQTLTIAGDYLNLIRKVVLSDNVEVKEDDFQSHSKDKITLIVPAEAQTGYIILADTAEIPLEYESDEMLQVVLPSVDKVESLEGRKPGNSLSIVGKDLDLIRKITTPGGSEVSFKVEEDVLTFTLPDDITDGTVLMIPASGVEVELAHIQVAVPQNLEILPVFGLRGGDKITVKGQNLELVTGVQFPGIEGAVQPLSKSDIELTVEFPMDAVSGEMVLNVGSGKNVVVEIQTLKPLVQSFSKNPAPAGAELKLYGQNLDLVSAVTFQGGLIMEANPAGKEELAVMVPLNTSSGTLVLTMANGETVTTSELEITPPTFAYLPNPPGVKAEIHAGGVLTVQAENGDHLVEVQVDGAAVNFIVDGTNLYIVIPGKAAGPSQLSLISYDGEAHYTIPVIGSGIIETIIYDDGLWTVNWGEGLRLNKDIFEDVAPGTKMKIYMAETGAGASLAVIDANWANLVLDDPNYDSQWSVLQIPEGTTDYEIELTAEILSRILSADDGWSQTAMMLTGDGVIISKISLISGSAPAETAIYEGVYQMNWSEGIRLYKEDFEGIRPGTTLRIYMNPASGASFAVQDANWAKVIIAGDPNFSEQWGSISVPDESTTYDITLTQAILNTILSVDDGWSTTAIILTGDSMTVTRITLVE